jgi:hypothetical protein
MGRVDQTVAFIALEDAPSKLRLGGGSREHFCGKAKARAPKYLTSRAVFR